MRRLLGVTILALAALLWVGAPEGQTQAQMIPSSATPDPRIPTPCQEAYTTHIPPCVSGASVWSGWTGLAHYWYLQEAAGVRDDAAGANDLTDNNTVTSGAGKNGDAASFAKLNTEYLSSADSAAFYLTGGKTFVFWVYPLDAVDNRAIFAEQSGAGNNYIAYLVAGTNRVDTYTYDTDGVSFSEIQSAAACTAGQWCLVFVWYDPADKKMHIQINNNAPEAAPAALPHGPRETNPPFTIGATGTPGFPHEGLIDEGAVFSVVITSDVRAGIWAAGAGRYYPN